MSDETKPVFAIEKIYVKDLSLEVTLFPYTTLFRSDRKSVV